MVYFGPPAQALGFFGVDDFADIYATCDRGPHPDAAEAWHARFKDSLQYQKYVVERPARAPAAAVERAEVGEGSARAARPRLGVAPAPRSARAATSS